MKRNLTRKTSGSKHAVAPRRRRTRRHPTSASRLSCGGRKRSTGRSRAHHSQAGLMSTLGSHPNVRVINLSAAENPGLAYRGTRSSNPSPSSKESCELRYGRRRPADQVVRRREHKMQRFKSARSAQHEILRWFVYRSRAGLVRRICSSARTVASTGRPRSHARRSAKGRLARGVSTPAPVPHTAGVNRTYLSKLETGAS